MTSGRAHSAAGAGAGRLKLVLLLTGGYMAVEVVGGILTGSLALIADAGHMLTDVAGVSMALLAIRFGARPANDGKSYGYYRLEILAAIVNAILLFGVAGYVLYEAYRRFLEPPEVLGLPMLAVATVGLLVNLVSARLLFGGQKSSLNLRGAFYEVVGDLLGSVAVIVAGIVIALTGWNLIDPIASVVIGLFILPRTWMLIRDAVNVLLEATPKGIDMGEVRRHIRETEGVADVHDLHAWTITSGMNVLSAHVVLADGAKADEVLDGLCGCLSADFDIEHSTFQLEPTDRRPREEAAH
ncbi:MAG: cation diffusion facilitator family transporter [Chloroflexi bacterium]|nr:cation diffusion facilitator family transporter [Chloroflexota bacterium]